MAIPGSIVNEFEKQWRSGCAPPDVWKFLQDHPSASPDQVLEVLLVDQHYRWKGEGGWPVETYLQRCPAVAHSATHRQRLILEEYGYLEDRGSRPDLESFLTRYGNLPPNEIDALRSQLTDQRMSSRLRETLFATEGMSNRVGRYGETGHENRPENRSVEIPEKIGRYRVEKLLGKGGFGLVYLAHDDQLKRRVAIKVPHANLIIHKDDAQLYLAEARTVAALDHPNIVPVFDIGQTDEFPIYVVSKFVEGDPLPEFLPKQRMSWTATAQLVASVAEALHYAHKRGLVHRDIKPGNVLIDADGIPHIVDFGLALNDNNFFHKGRQFVGTPAYMSPEQARGESHRVDGRSDIYSLGAVLYQMLVGRRTFVAESQASLLQMIAGQDPKPPRQIDDAVPKPLERICLKALARRASDRYTTALDMAGDLSHYLAQRPVDSEKPPTADITIITDRVQNETLADSDAARHDSTSRAFRIVPKGLRSFDEHDSDFFLELLPGPRDRNGLPNSIRFWKTHIEETDSDKTFSVGLIYGPSGCGKSSLVKAGLLPRLSADVITVYVEATADDTPSRLARELQKSCPRLEAGLTLKDTLEAMRHGHGVPEGRKVLIVIDQFEQWLHAHKDDFESELVQALRQCDGGHVQCLLMARDDFWMSVSRFFNAMEVELNGQNFAPFDLFPTLHAEKVLAAFGRAFGILPEDTDSSSADHMEFLKQSVAGLAEEGKVVCVRLALFAEMMKDKPWTPTTLKAVGGTEGVGVTFLEETFNGQTANPNYRLHQPEARAVLTALLPEAGSNIKGNMRSYQSLYRASGCKDDATFCKVLAILDGETRLITPVDSGTVAPDQLQMTSLVDGEMYYQLTHDYLVPSLRHWLTQKQKESRRGRAELRLAERSAQWNLRREKRHLPALWEWLNIRLFTDTKKWTRPQREMMRTANRRHGLRWSLGVVVFLGMSLTLQQIAASARYRTLIDRTRTAVQTMANSRGTIVPRAIEDLEDYPSWMVLEELQTQFTDSNDSQELALAYALAHFGSVDPDLLVAHINVAPASEVDNLVDALTHSRNDSLELINRAAVESEAKQDWNLKYRLGIVGFHLGNHSLLQSMCELRPKSNQRTLVIEQFESWPGPHARRLAELASTIKDSALISAVCLGIGGAPPDQMTAEMKQTWQPTLENWFENETDAGVHSAAGWVLHQWGISAPAIAQSMEPDGEYNWHVNNLGLTMLVIDAGSFLRENQEVTLTRPFLICDREVSLGLFQQFIDDIDYPSDKKPEDWPGANRPSGPSAARPVQNVSWYDAILFCNWLSSRHGLQPCYERTVAKTSSGTQVDDWTLNPIGNGYRLPTEAEWEYACRAGTTTKFCFGDDIDDKSMLYRHAVVDQPTPEDCGSKLPNGWGLFDMHGNVGEWCQDWHGAYETGSAVKDPSGPVNGANRVLRGGTFNFIVLAAASSEYRNQHPPDTRANVYGFRVARNYDRR